MATESIRTYRIVEEIYRCRLGDKLKVAFQRDTLVVVGETRKSPVFDDRDSDVIKIQRFDIPTRLTGVAIEPLVAEPLSSRPVLRVEEAKLTDSGRDGVWAVSLNPDGESLVVGTRSRVRYVTHDLGREALQKGKMISPLKPPNGAHRVARSPGPQMVGC